MSETSNFQLERYCRNLNIKLIACCCKDELPETFYEGGFIINLNDSTNLRPTAHWTAFFTEKNGSSNQACYFDSFGVTFPVEVGHYLRSCKSVIVNKTQVQNLESGWCGIYCVYFLYYMQNNKKRIPNIEKRFYSFIELFNEHDPEKNLTILKRKFSKLI